MCKEGLTVLMLCQRTLFNAEKPASLESELLPSHHNPYCSTLLMSHRHKAQSMLPVLMLLRDLDSQGIAKPGVQKTAELPKTVQRQHNNGCQQATKELPKDIYESRVPVAVENYGWAENPSRVQGCSCKLAACRAGTENVLAGSLTRHIPCQWMITTRALESWLHAELQWQLLWGANMCTAQMQQRLIGSTLQKKQLCSKGICAVEQCPQDALLLENR